VGVFVLLAVLLCGVVYVLFFCCYYVRSINLIYYPIYYVIFWCTQLPSVTLLFLYSISINH